MRIFSCALKKRSRRFLIKCYKFSDPIQEKYCLDKMANEIVLKANNTKDLSRMENGGLLAGGQKNLIKIKEK